MLSAVAVAVAILYKYNLVVLICSNILNLSGVLRNGGVFLLIAFDISFSLAAASSVEDAEGGKCSLPHPP